MIAKGDVKLRHLAQKARRLARGPRGQCSFHRRPQQRLADELLSRRVVLATATLVLDRANGPMRACEMLGLTLDGGGTRLPRARRRPAKQLAVEISQPLEQVSITCKGVRKCPV